MLWDIGMQGITVLALSLGNFLTNCSVVFLISLLEYLKQKLWAHDMEWVFLSTRQDFKL